MADIEDLAVLAKHAQKVAPRSPKSLREVVARGCCMGCGICEGILGSDFVRMEVRGPKRRMRPTFLRNALPQDLEARALSACPGAAVHSPVVEPGVTDDLIVGPVRSVSLGYAADPDVRFRAAAGGGLSALGAYLLESRRVKFVLHVRGCAWHGDVTQQGLALQEVSREARRQKVCLEAEVLAGRGSRYGPVAPLRSLGAVLARNEPFALIGKPCDVNAVSNYARVEPRIDELCLFKLTISCGTYADNDGADRFIKHHGIEETEIQEFRWRGHGCPGPCPFVKATDGRTASMDYKDYWYKNGSYAGPLTYQWRCKTCPDFLGHQADVTVMDIWPQGQPQMPHEVTPERASEQAGWVYIVARTQRGQDLVDGAKSAGRLMLERASVEKVIDSQPHQVSRAVRLLSLRLAQRLKDAPQPWLDERAHQRMVEAALKYELLPSAAADAPGADASSDKEVLPQFEADLSAIADPKLSSVLLRLPAAAVRFQAEKFSGALLRLDRGDAEESLESPASAL